MENLRNVNARVFLIWVGDRRRHHMGQKYPGMYWKEVCREYLEESRARRLAGYKPYYHHVNALD